jgi:hypothetical protein
VSPRALAVLRLIIEFELRGLLDGYAAPLAALNWSVAKRTATVDGLPTPVGWSETRYGTIGG